MTPIMLSGSRLSLLIPGPVVPHTTQRSFYLPSWGALCRADTCGLRGGSGDAYQSHCSTAYNTHACPHARTHARHPWHVDGWPSEQYSEEALSLNSSFVVWMTHSGPMTRGEGGLSIPNPPASHWVTSLTLLLVVIHAGHRMGLDLCYLDIRKHKHNSKPIYPNYQRWSL